MTIPIINDEIVESPEVFRLELQDPSTGTLVLSPTTATATGIIIDDDSKNFKGLTLAANAKFISCHYA